MSVIVSPPVGAPPGSRRGFWRPVLAALVMVAALAASLFTSAVPAHAGSLGVGYESDYGALGAFATGQNGDGALAYCMDAGNAAPFSLTTGPQTVSELDSLTRQQLAELNYVLAKWGQSSDPSVTAAVALYTWQVASPDIYNANGGAGHYLIRVPADQRATVTNNLAAFGQEAAANAVTDPALSLSISMSDQYHGTLTVGANPAGLPVSVTLTDAVLTGSGSASGTLSPGAYAITGTPADGAPSYRISATGSADGTGYGAHVNLYTSGAGEQRIINAVSGIPAALNAQATSPVIELDFQPELTTAVTARYVHAGDAFTDKLTATVTKGTWIKLNGTPVPVKADGVLYGPFDAQPAQAATPPAGAPVAGRETVTLTGAGDYTSTGSIKAASSGFYVWVWAIDKTAQGQYGKYLTGSFTDQFALVPESHVSPFQPKAVSTANGHLVNPGTEVTDTIVVTSSNGPWLKLDGKPIPVIFTGTAYQVPGTLPPAQGTVPAGARPVGVVQVTANGPGTYTSPPVTLPSPGFVTWVWTAKITDQPASVRDYLAGDFTDNYGIPVETHSVRWPVTVTSQVREYNVVAGGRAFDTITVSGFPTDHPGFAGDGYWKADAPEVVNTVYGPFVDDAVLTDDLDLARAPVLTRITVPAKNGVYKLGYSDADRIAPTGPGYYVVVTSFAGDDRVQPYASSPGDILERFYVPGPTPPPLSVITQATAKAGVGEVFSDTALVQGQTPDGAYLVFRAYGPQPAKDSDGKAVAAVCETPFFESERVPVTQAGIYHSGETRVDEAGNVYWVETLYGPDDAVLVAGVCGAPGETTTVTEPVPPTVTTQATAQVQLGQPAHDTAIVTGTVPDGATVTFEAYRQPGQPATGQAGEAEAVCTPETRVFTSAPVAVSGPGSFDSEDTTFNKTGTYFWVETLTGKDGTVLAHGECGAPGETTVVTDAPDTPAGPRVDTGGALAETGAPGWVLPVGVLAALMLIASGLALWFGRRLAQRREAEGYVREEDQPWTDINDQN